jgi:uncharacterized protein with LGFP repeats
MTSWKTRAVGVIATAVAALGVAAPAHADAGVTGEIGYRYDVYYGGSRGWLGLPTTPETRTPNGKGAYVAFQNGSIYWSPWTGAREVHGEIRDGWGRLGWEGGQLGFPTTDAETTYSRRGQYQDFEGGRMYWAPWSGAHELHGKIRETYEDFYASDTYSDGEDTLGFPTSSETRTPNGRGAYNTFQWGAIYWSPSTGAQPVYGEIQRVWARQGWENGRLGFPVDQDESVSDYEDGVDLHVQTFEGGQIYWSPSDCYVLFDNQNGYEC